MKDKYMESFVDTGHGDYWKQDDASGTIRCEGENRPSRPSNVITGCLNPWDSQTIRIYDGNADSFHAVNANSGGGQNREGIVMEEKIETKTDEIMCVHGSQDPITNDGDHANAIGRNQGAETAIAENVGNEDAKSLKLTKTVRRLMPVETEILMGMPPNHTIPCFKPEDITDELVDKFIEIFYEWDLMNMNSKKKKKEKSDAEEETEDVEATVESDGGGDAEAEEEDEIEAEAETESETDDEGIEAASAAETEETTEETGEPKKEKDEAPKLPKRRSRKVVRAWLLQISNPKTCPDGPRYKCCGNSFGCNVVRWIGLGIQAVEDKYAEEK